MNEIDFKTVMDMDKSVVAIVQFGPPTVDSGMRVGTYFQVTIDVNRFSKSREFIRFGTHKGDEINGWQRADSIAVVDILADFTGEDMEIPWYKKE